VYVHAQLAVDESTTRFLECRWHSLAASTCANETS